MNKKVNEWIDAHKQELLDDIKELCSIPSVIGEAKPGMPFGQECSEALAKALEMAGSYGFPTHNIENYVGYADFDPALPHTLDMLAHTDVVPAGEGWTVTEPFNIIEKDGRLYGRGTSDDKGPLLCGLYAMRALKETGAPITKGIRMIVGSDEETGSIDITKYYALHEEAEMTFTPDAEFPLINIEKGQFRGKISGNYEEDVTEPRILSLKAGLAANAVPQKAVIRFAGLDMEAAEPVMKAAADELGVEILASGEQEITVIGVGAHASTPEMGKNAGLAAVILAGRLSLADSQMTRNLAKIPELFPWGITDGSGLGIKISDEKSGELTCTLDLFTVTGDHMEFVFDSRTPVSAVKENCQDVAARRVEELGLDFETPGMVPPHAVPEDGEFVQTLLKSYEKYSGLPGSCLAIGGGTYVHELKNGVAFGAIMPGVDTHMHGADEFFDIDGIILATKIFADALLELCK